MRRCQITLAGVDCVGWTAQNVRYSPSLQILTGSRHSPHYQKRLEDALIKGKRLKWSRASRNEKYGKLLAARESLRALYAQIDLKKMQFVQARAEFGGSNSIVEAHRSELRDSCLKGEIPEEHTLWQDANSSDYDHDTGSITDTETEFEDLDSSVMGKIKKVRYSYCMCMS